MKTLHTELPWKRVGDFVVPVTAEKDKTEYGYQSGHYIATCHDTLKETKSFNAEFIVKACNSYYDLVEVLNDIIEDYNFREITQASINKAFKALDKAKGE